MTVSEQEAEALGARTPDASSLELSYRAAFDSVACSLGYFDYHQEAHQLDSEEPLQSVSIEQLNELARINHLTFTPTSKVHEKGVDDLLGLLSLLLVGENKVSLVILEYTPGHWRVFDIKQRTENIFQLKNSLSFRPWRNSMLNSKAMTRESSNHQRVSVITGSSKKL